MSSLNQRAIYQLLRRSRLRRSDDGGSIYVPPQPSLLRAWVEADVGVTLNGSDVSGWLDQSESEWHFSQSTALSQPTLVASSQNGLPGINFSDSVDYLSSDLAASDWRFLHDGTGCTGILVIKAQSDSGNPWLFGTSTNANGSVGLSAFYFSANNQMRVRVRNSEGVAGEAAALSLITPGAAQIVSWRYDESLEPSIQVFDGATLIGAGNTTLAPSAGNPSSSLVLGNYAGLNGSLRGTLYAAMIWQAALLDEELATEVARLKTKWGIA